MKSILFILASVCLLSCTYGSKSGHLRVKKDTVEVLPGSETYKEAINDSLDNLVNLMSIHSPESFDHIVEQRIIGKDTILYDKYMVLLQDETYYQIDKEHQISSIITSNPNIFKLYSQRLKANNIQYWADAHKEDGYKEYKLYWFAIFTPIYAIDK